MPLLTRRMQSLLLGATLAAIVACGGASHDRGIPRACDAPTAVRPLDASSTNRTVSLPAESITRFEGIIDRLMRDLKTPGLSALILKNQQVVWE